VARLKIRNRLPCHYTQSTLGCRKPEHRLQNHYIYIYIYVCVCIQNVPKRCIHKVNIPYYNVYTSFWDNLYIYAYISLLLRQQFQASTKEGCSFLPNKRRQPNIFYYFCLHVFFFLRFHSISTLQI
jgi:hypothetical protein